MTGVDPFLDWSDEALFNVHLSLALSCARTKTTLRNPTRKVLCNALSITKVQLTNRGQLVPVAPFHYGQMKRDKDGKVVFGPAA